MLQFVWVFPESSERTGQRKGPSIIKLHVHMDTGDFPAQDWGGEPLLLLAAWMNDAARLAQDGHSVRSSLSVFHQGPFHFEVTLTQNGLVTLRFLRATDTGLVQELPAVSVPYRDYAGALLESGEHLLEASRARGYGDDFEWTGLEANIDRLRRTLAHW